MDEVKGKYFTQGGNLKTMTKTQLVNNIVAAWDMITPESICNSFKICGQILDVNPNEINCIKKGQPCEGGLTMLKQLLQFPTHQLDLNALSMLPEGIVQEIDINMNLDMIDYIEEEDPLY